ncbi:hypothetical protein Tco_1072431, partial [Tanacetum coccineum]
HGVQNKDVRSLNVRYGEREMEDGAPERGSVLWSVRPKLMETKVPKFLAKYGEVSGKIYKTSGSSSINTKSGEASIKLNVDVGDDEEDEGALGSSSMNDKALARLMVSEMAMHTKCAIEMQKEERKAFLEIKM